VSAGAEEEGTLRRKSLRECGGGAGQYAPAAIQGLGGQRGAGDVEDVVGGGEIDVAVAGSKSLGLQRPQPAQHDRHADLTPDLPVGHVEEMLAVRKESWRGMIEVAATSIEVTGGAWSTTCRGNNDHRVTLATLQQDHAGS